MYNPRLEIVSATAKMLSKAAEIESLDEKRTKLLIQYACDRIDDARAAIEFALESTEVGNESIGV